MFIIDHAGFTPLFTPVIIVRSHLFQIRLCRTVLDPPVKIQNARLIFIDQLTRTYQPVLQEFLRRRRLAVQILKISLRHGWPVKIAPLKRFSDIAVKFFSVSKEEPVLDPMGGRSRPKSPLFKLIFQFPKHIPLRPHLIRIPV